VEIFGTQNLSTSLASSATFPADIAETVSEWLEAADGSVGLCLGLHDPHSRPLALWAVEITTSAAESSGTVRLRG
jgi:hypothetical protein